MVGNTQKEQGGGFQTRFIQHINQKSHSITIKNINPLIS